MTPRIQLSLFDAAQLAPSYVLTPDAEGQPDMRYLPQPAHPGEDTGADIRACLRKPVQLAPGESAIIPAGFKIHLPKLESPFLLDYQIRSRSGLSRKHGVIVVNQPATIDPGYRGWIEVTLYRLPGFGEEPFVIEDGDRVAQAVLAIAVDQGQLAALCVSELPGDSQRGEAGFGSTGVA